MRLGIVALLAISFLGMAVPSTLAQTVVRVPADMTLQSAIDTVSDGGVIEMAAGTYAAPSGGFVITDEGRGFTIRAASGASVTLSGGGTKLVVTFINSDISLGRPVVFQGIEFADGYSSLDGRAGGVTLQRAEATFVDCSFVRNNGDAPSVGGGGALVGVGSTAFFFGSTWTDNRSKIGGAGIAIGSGSTVYVHDSEFQGNRVNYPGHHLFAGGAALNIGDSVVRVTNSRFVDNQAGYVGGAVYVIGTWTDPVTTPTAELTIANCLFESNQSKRDPGVSSALPTEGGAVHGEDQSTTRIYNSRFISNEADTGGAVNLFRAEMEVYSSVFKGNTHPGTPGTPKFGGTINGISNDGNDATTGFGAINRRSAKLVLHDSYLQGRVAGQTRIPNDAGCVFVGGDSNRMYGQSGVSQMGGLAENRATAEIRRSIFYDCDSNGAGGALEVGLAAATVSDSIATQSDGAFGGGLAVIVQSLAEVTNSTFADNSASLYGGGVFVQGSTISFSGSRLLRNTAASGGSAFYSEPDVGRNLKVDGMVSGNVFAGNTGSTAIQENDDNSAVNYNAVQYDANAIRDGSALIFSNWLVGLQTVAGLNAAVVMRAGGPSTDKSPSGNNTAPPSDPVVGQIVASPPEILASGAAGETGPFPSYVGYAWGGSATATFNGASRSGGSGLESQLAPGVQTLLVSSSSFTDDLSSASVPSASLTATPSSLSSGGSSTLAWDTPTGSSLESAIDHGVGASAFSSGSTSVTPSASTAYRSLAVTREGGSVAIATVIVDGSGVLLPAPTVAAPFSGQVIGVQAVTFSWSSVGGAAGYQVFVWDSSTAGQVFSGSLTGESSTSTVISLPEGTYDFGVRACTAGGFTDATCGAFGTVDFEIDLISPTGSPTVTAPSDGSVLTSSTVSFTWTAVAGDPLLSFVKYDVLVTQLGTGLTVLQVSEFDPTTSTVYSLGSGDYQVKVRACQAGCGPWSTPVSFTVSLPAVPTSGPTISSCSVSGGNSLTCTWSSVSGANFYQIQVIQPDTGPGGGALTVAARQVSGTSATFPVPSGPASVLVWACNGDGCGPASGVYGINPAGPNPALPNLGTPMGGSVAGGPYVLFTWSRVPGDNGSNTTYRLYVRDFSRQDTALDILTTQNYWGAYLKAEGTRYDALAIVNPDATGAGGTAGPAASFNLSGSSAQAPTMVQPIHQSEVPAGNVSLGWSPVEGAGLYEYYVASGANVVRGVTPGLLVQVPLEATGDVWNGITRACLAGDTCTSESPTGWGPWSNEPGGTGITQFTVVP